jgi:hypothetical protein
MIHAGTAAQINWGKGDWIFLDVGFSSTARSCGLLVGDGEPRCITFAEAHAEIKKAIARLIAPNLVIEAPLSASFNSSGNPTGRSIELEGTKARYWYTGPGCAVMVASMYLIRDLALESETASIRLFEGFVSYKSSKPSGHREDVLALRSVVQNPRKFHRAIYEAHQLKKSHGDELFSAFRVAGLDYGIPAVIKPTPDVWEGI